MISICLFILKTILPYVTDEGKYLLHTHEPVCAIMCLIGDSTSVCFQKQKRTFLLFAGHHVSEAKESDP